MNEYTVGLYATDIKIVPEVVSADEDQSLSAKYQLKNYPNPFNPSTTISFEISQPSQLVTLEIYNIKGQKVKELFGDQLSAGQHSIIWDGVDENQEPLSSGVYFYNLISGGKSVATDKCLLLK